MLISFFPVLVTFYIHACVCVQQFLSCWNQKICQVECHVPSFITRGGILTTNLEHNDIYEPQNVFNGRIVPPNDVEWQMRYILKNSDKRDESWWEIRFFFFRYGCCAITQIKGRSPYYESHRRNILHLSLLVPKYKIICHAN